MKTFKKGEKRALAIKVIRKSICKGENFNQTIGLLMHKCDLSYKSAKIFYGYITRGNFL